MSKKLTKPGIYQIAYDGNVVYRMFNEDDEKMRAFHEEYKDNCHTRSTRTRVPTKEEFAMVKDWLSGLGKTIIAKKYGLSSPSYVDYTITRVARYQMAQNGV